MISKRRVLKTNFILLKVATAVVMCLTFFLLTYTFHCTWVTSEAYSSPSIVLSARSYNGDKIIFDDFREAYYWLRYNTPEVRVFLIVESGGL